MTGPQKAALIIALAVVALLAFNWALWRRMKMVLRDAGEREAGADAEDSDASRRS